MHLLEIENAITLFQRLKELSIAGTKAKEEYDVGGISAKEYFEITGQYNVVRQQIKSLTIWRS